MQPKLYPRLMLAVLTGLNILNYVDRNILFAVQSEIQKEFVVSKAEIGVLTSAFFFTYMFAAPLVGWMGDRFPRKNIVVFGIIIWSGFTLLTWFTHDYWQLLIRHAIVGIGEASYATIAPTLIADSFPLAKRGRMLSIFFLGLPVGSAVGYFAGGLIGYHWGWRMPFMIAGIPGFLLALLLWMLPEPPRGQTEEIAPSNVRSTLSGLLRNVAFVIVSLGMALYTFAVGGMQVWIPTFLVQLRGMNLQTANIVFAIILGFNGVFATLLGGWLGDRWLKKYFGAYYSFSGIAMLVAVPFMVLAIYTKGKMMLPAIFVAVFLLLVGTGPSNAALVNSVGPQIRSTALAVNVFIIHLLGDAFSPAVIGRIADWKSLPVAFWTAFLAAAISGVIFLYGARFAPKLGLDKKSISV